MWQGSRNNRSHNKKAQQVVNLFIHIVECPWYHHCSKANDFISFLTSQLSLVCLHFSLAIITLIDESPSKVYTYNSLLSTCQLVGRRMPRVGEIKDDDLKRFFNMLEADNTWNTVIVNNTFEFLLVNQEEDTNRERRWDIQTVPKVGKPSVTSQYEYPMEKYHPVCISGKCR